MFTATQKIVLAFNLKNGISQATFNAIRQHYINTVAATLGVSPSLITATLTNAITFRRASFRVEQQFSHIVITVKTTDPSTAQTAKTASLDNSYSQTLNTAITNSGISALSSNIAVRSTSLNGEQAHSVISNMRYQYLYDKSFANI